MPPAFPFASDTGDLLPLLAVVVALAVGGLFFIVRVAMVQGTGHRPEVGAAEERNCPSCGARVAADRWDYCGEPLPGRSGSDRK